MRQGNNQAHKPTHKQKYIGTLSSSHTTLAPNTIHTHRVFLAFRAEKLTYPLYQIFVKSAGI